MSRCRSAILIEDWPGRAIPGASKLPTFKAERTAAICRPATSNLTGSDPRKFGNLSVCKMRLALLQRLTRRGIRPDLMDRNLDSLINSQKGRNDA